MSETELTSKEIAAIVDAAITSAKKDYESMCMKLLEQHSARYDEAQSVGSAVYLGTFTGLIERSLNETFGTTDRRLAMHARAAILSASINFVRLDDEWTMQ